MEQKKKNIPYNNPFLVDPDKPRKPKKIPSKKHYYPETVQQYLKKPTEFSKLLEEYTNYFLGSRSPFTEHMLHRLGLKVLEFAQETDRFRIDWFFIEQGIPTATIRSWVNRYPEFAQYYYEARHILALRREEMALKGEVNPSMVQYTQIIYDQDWRDAAEYRASLKINEQGGAPTNVNIVISELTSKHKEITNESATQESTTQESTTEQSKQTPEQVAQESRRVGMRSSPHTINIKKERP